MNKHHQRALKVLAVTMLLDVILGILYAVAENIHVLHGMYCAVGTATTVGCDIPPDNGFSYVLSAVMMLTVVPLFAAVFSFFTSGLTADHVDARHKQMKEHISGTQRLPEAGD